MMNLKLRMSWLSSRRSTLWYDFITVCRLKRLCTLKNHSLNGVSKSKLHSSYSIFRLYLTMIHLESHLHNPSHQRSLLQPSIYRSQILLLLSHLIWTTWISAPTVFNPWRLRKKRLSLFTPLYYMFCYLTSYLFCYMWTQINLEFFLYTERYLGRQHLL